MRFEPSVFGLLLALSAGCSHNGAMKPHYESAIGELDKAVATKPGAKQPDAVSQALLPPLVIEMPRNEGRSPDSRFDLAVNNAPAAEVFMAIASGTRYSMVVNPGIKEKISINLRDVNVFEALDTVREIYGYEYKMQGNRILIQPLTMQTRMFQINYLFNQRKGKSELRVSSGAISDSAGSTQSGATTATTGPQSVTTQNLQSSRIETTTELNFWGDLASGVRAIIGAAEGRNVIVNADSGVVLVRALPAELREVDNFLHAMQGVVSRQVLLEAKIIEVQLSDTFATGINWGAFRSGSSTAVAGGVLQPGTRLSPQGPLSTFTSIG